MPKQRSKSRQKKRRQKLQPQAKPPQPKPLQGALQVRSQADFERYLDGARPVIVDFWAPWCGPCKAMAPTFERVARTFEGRAHFLKVNTEQLPELASALGIRSIPTLVVLLGDQVINSHVGLTDEKTLAQMVEKAVDRSQGITWGTKLRRIFSREAPAADTAAASPG